MNEFDFSEGHWDGPYEDPLEADSSDEAVAISEYGDSTIMLGDETREEHIIIEDGLPAFDVEQLR